MVRTFQLTRVLSKMTVLENVMLAAPDQPGMRVNNALFRRRAGGGARRRCGRRRWGSCEIGIEKHAEAYAATLSGGQCKLLELARALITHPRLVLLDEPMAGVNPTLGRRLLDYLGRLRTEGGLTVLFVEHDMDAVMERSDEVIVMAEGAAHRPRPPRRGAQRPTGHRRLPRRRPGHPVTTDARAPVLEADGLVGVTSPRWTSCGGAP